MQFRILSTWVSQDFHQHNIQFFDIFRILLFYDEVQLINRREMVDIKLIIFANIDKRSCLLQRIRTKFLNFHQIALDRFILIIIITHALLVI